MSDFKLLTEKFPFLTLFEYADEEYLGIVQNQGKTMTSVYVYNNIHTKDDKVKFLELGETWWWESNRKVPINLFLKEDFSKFDYSLRCFNTKDFKVIEGHVVNISNMNEKRVKRRKIELVRSDK